MIVKVCGITSEHDAWMAIEAGANALGFNFWPGSPRYITPQPWIKKLPVLKVGIFVGKPEELDGLDVAQIYGDETPESIRIWRAVKPGAEHQGAEAYVMDVSEGKGIPFDWTAAAGTDDRIVLAGGLDAQNVAEAIRVARPWGVDACSRLEEGPGRKDAAKVREFVAAAREAFHSL